MRIRNQILRLMGIPADSDPAILQKLHSSKQVQSKRQMDGLTWCWGRQAGRSRCRSPHRTADGILERSSPFFSLLWCSTFVNTNISKLLLNRIIYSTYLLRIKTSPCSVKKTTKNVENQEYCDGCNVNSQLRLSVNWWSLAV
jgi:hypothetical protein